MDARSFAASPAVWRGTELFERPDRSITLTDSELHALEVLARDNGDPHASDTPAPSGEPLPPDLTARVVAVRAALETGSGADRKSVV